MARDKLKNKSQLHEPQSSRIKSGTKAETLDGFLRFSFKFYDNLHEKFRCDDRAVDYFHKLLARIRDLSKEKTDGLISSRTNKTTRFHRIDFSGDNVTVNGFGINGWEDCDDEAWQFSITTNEHGRVHGFLIENTFYVVWLDPEHKLYA